VDVSEPASISTGIAARYATAMFELAQEGGALDALEADVAALEAAMADSADLSDLISSPIYGRDETQAAPDGVRSAGCSCCRSWCVRCASRSPRQGRGHGRGDPPRR
jgi:hypothetical protein